MAGKRLVVLIVLLILLATFAADAQVITGNIIGTVKDASGAVVPGATAMITSPALIGGPSVFTSNQKGQYRFMNLAPGVYALEVTLSGFASYREEGLRVEVGGTLERNIALKLAGVSENVIVSGASPLLDARKAGISTNYGSEMLDDVPVRRISTFDLMRSAPGVSATSELSVSMSVFGSGTNENAFLLDGTNFTGPAFGGPVPFADTDIVEEIEVVSLGASAEYGNFQGGIFNVVTKQGGNDFRFDASYYVQPSGLTSQSVLLDCNCPDGESGYERDRYHDFTTHLGGPILKDRLWFFGGYQLQREAESQPGADPRFPAAREADRIFWKINWQITPRLTFLHSYHDDYWAAATTPTVSSPLETTSTISGHNPTSTFGQLTHLMSDSTFWEARVSRFRGSFKTTPNSGSLTTPFRFDAFTGVASGNAPFFGEGDESRTSIQGKLSHYATDFLASDHDFKFGVQFVHGSDRALYGYPGGALYVEYAGYPLFAYFRETYSYGGESGNLGAFVDDVVNIGDRLTLNLGLRFDYTEAISPDIPATDAGGNETGETIEGRGTLYTWSTLSPRLGLNLKLTADGRTALRASYGRFYQGVLNSELHAVHPGLTPTTFAFFDPSTGDYSAVFAVVDPLSQVGIDPDTDPPKTDQFSIGVDREIAPNMAVGVTYVRKEGRNFIGWQDNGGVYGSDTVTLENGTTLTIFPLLNSTDDRFFLLTNRKDFFMEYEGLLLTLTKRWSKRWQARVSYTLSEAVGLQNRVFSEAGSSQTSSTFGFNTRGRDPNDLTNATGNLRNDRTHMFRIQGSAEIPKIDVLVGANFQFSSGKPWAGWATIDLPQGTRVILAEPRGSRRLSSQSLLDLRVSKIFRFKERAQLELLVDIFNLLDDTAEERLVSENLFSPNFGEGSRFVRPRRAMIGVKFRF